MNSHEAVKELKRRILVAAHRANEGHVASAFSVLDILYVLYQNIRIDPKRPTLASRDYVFLSKGHASLALYAVLAEKGFFDISELNYYCSLISPLGGHPHRNCVLGVEASTGSLGHGLPMAAGCAMSLKHDLEHNHVYCIVGDGELNEGSMWEALLLAGQHKLSNLTVFIDYNHSNDRAIDLHPLVTKIRSMGRISTGEIDGHNHDEIALTCRGECEFPSVFICHTTKGKGIREMEENPHAWHHRSPTDSELVTFLEEL
ncbi:MAG: transketolase [Planctomycetota bacterium]|jgi:transketolase